MKVIRSNWLPFLVVPTTALVVAGALWAELRQTERNVHRVIKPVPALSNIAPNSSPSRDSTLTITVSGDGFVDGASLVQWDGEDLPTTFESTSELTARISPQRLSTPGDVAITVFNPEPGGGTSTSMTFTVTEAAPSLDLFVPVVVSLSGADGPTYTSEMTLTNKTDTAVTLSFRYTATPSNVTGHGHRCSIAPGAANRVRRHRVFERPGPAHRILGQSSGNGDGAGFGDFFARGRRHNGQNQFGRS